MPIAPSSAQGYNPFRQFCVLNKTFSDLTTLEAVFHHAPFGILIVDREDRVVSFNGAAASLLGGGDFQGRACASLLSGRNLKVRRVDLAGEGRSLLFVVPIASDGTEIGELAATVAHEIRNPLASILAAVENLRDELEMTGAPADSIRKIVEHVRRLDASVERLLVFAKLMKPSPTEYDLSALLQSSLEVIRREPGSREIEFEVHYPGRCRVVGDPQLIEHAVSNVLRNAVQAVGAKGRVAVRVERTEDRVTILIRDNGPGIPERNREAVFRPFFTTKAQGSGQGLSIARKMVEAHGGRIDLASETGKGTEVRIVLPRVYA